jgi:4-amino-4-deoxy-L-arabinose transferase-like glycosyltransferase
MRITFPEGLTRVPAARKTLQIPRERILPLAALAAIVILAARLRFANLEAIGYGNTYYSAAVKSMLQSWHNFFFVAAEPGGSVSVDKPPLGLWLQAISAYFLGVSGFAVVLPEIIAGLLSVVLVYHLVRRSFGDVAGLLAGLVLAITPVVIATDRNNTIDSTLIFTLLLAAWAFIKATEIGKLRHLLLGAALVDIGFNIKMLQAYLPCRPFTGCTSWVLKSACGAKPASWPWLQRCCWRSRSPGRWQST